MRSLLTAAVLLVSLGAHAADPCAPELERVDSNAELSAHLLEMLHDCLTADTGCPGLHKARTLHRDIAKRAWNDYARCLASHMEDGFLPDMAR